MTTNQPRLTQLAPVLFLDAALVVLFAVLGRASHALDLGIAGVVQTAAPFLVSLVAAWGLLAISRTNPRTIRGGLLVWIMTVTIGLFLRVVTGETAALAFIIVTFAVLGAFFLSIRLLLRVLTARHRQHEDSESLLATQTTPSPSASPDR